VVVRKGLPEIRDYRRSLERSRQSRVGLDRPTVFSLAGREWDLLPDVFAPNHSPTTGFSLTLLDLAEPSGRRRSGALLEMGCGTGVIAVSAAIAGCAPVVAADINPAAVDNAHLNAVRHGMAKTVRAVQSDLFDNLSPAERFDLVFWHSNYVLAPADYRYASIHESAYVDPGYAAHRRFLTEAPAWCTPTGSVLLHFSARGDYEALTRIAAECGRALRVRRRALFLEGDREVEHMLIEVTVAR